MQSTNRQGGSSARVLGIWIETLPCQHAAFDTTNYEPAAVAQLLAKDVKLHGDRRGTGGITNGTSLEQVIMYLLRRDETRNLPKVCSQCPMARTTRRVADVRVVQSGSLGLFPQCRSILYAKTNPAHNALNSQGMSLCLSRNKWRWRRITLRS